MLLLLLLVLLLMKKRVLLYCMRLSLLYEAVTVEDSTVHKIIDSDVEVHRSAFTDST